MDAEAAGNSAIAQGDAATAVAAKGVAIDGNSSGDINTGNKIDAAAGASVILAEAGATVIIGEAPVKMTAVDRDSALGKYLHLLISQNRYLQLQGIRSGGKLVNIELDRIYVTLRAARQHDDRASAEWLAGETALAPGERHRGMGEMPVADTTHVSVNQALADHKRLVVLGDPGSGKTTLLRYLTLLYARDRAERTQQVQDKLGIADADALSIFLPLRNIGSYMAQHHAKDDGTQGHALLLQFLASIISGCAAGRIGGGSCRDGALDVLGAFAVTSAIGYIVQSVQNESTRNEPQYKWLKNTLACNGGCDEMFRDVVSGTVDNRSWFRKFFDKLTEGLTVGYGYGGQAHLFVGVSGDAGVLVDSSKSICPYVNICVNAGPGVVFEGGQQYKVSPGKIDNGWTRMYGGFVTGSLGLSGSGQFLFNGDGQIQAVRGRSGVGPPGGAFGGSMCFQYVDKSTCR
jgi:energy-coupling factor transporter ATP-binding protein EcfA2